MASPSFQLFPEETYVVADASLSAVEMQFLLCINAAIDPLAEPIPNRLIVPDKEALFWDVLNLWVVSILPDDIDSYLLSVHDAALGYYDRAELQPPSSLDPTWQPFPPRDLVVNTLGRFQLRLQERARTAVDPRSLIPAIARRVARLSSDLTQRGLLVDPVTFDVSLGQLLLSIGTLSLVRGRYFSLTQDGKNVRRELVLGLLSYRSQTGHREVGEPAKETKEILLEWNIPAKVLELLVRAVGTSQQTREALTNPKRGR